MIHGLKRMRLAILVAVIVAGAVLAAFSPGRSSASVNPQASVAQPTYYAVDIRSHQFNMCENACAVANDPRNLVAFFNASGGSYGAPWSIALNEVCADTAFDLEGITGLTAHFSTTKNGVAGCPSNDRRFGNAVLVSGPTVSGTALQWQFPTQHKSPCSVPGGDECRKMVCATFGSYAGNVTSCSAHLQNGSLSVAASQANEYVYIANSTYSGGRWLAGDFNLQPSQVPSVFNSGFYRAPNYLTFSASDPYKQIDYIWHDRAHSAFNTSGWRHCDPTYSDHCYTFAKFG